MKKKPCKNPTKWEENPVVELVSMLSKESWFPKDAVNFRPDEASWQNHVQSGAKYPVSASIKLTYLGKEIGISMDWADYYRGREKMQFEGHIFSRNITIPTLRCGFSSRTFSGIMKKVEDGILIAMEAIDKEVEEERKREEKERKEKEEVRKLEMRLGGVHLDRDTNNWLTYKPSRHFRLYFYMMMDESGNREDIYHNFQITGSFTEEELKKVIQIVGGNPRAVAERMING
jgi:hypothetical protein